MGAPGGPLLACCTASIAKVRIVLMQSVSSCLPVTTACSLTAMRCPLLTGTTSPYCNIAPLASLLEFREQKRVSATATEVYQFPANPCLRLCENTGKCGKQMQWKKRRKKWGETKKN